MFDPSQTAKCVRPSRAWRTTGEFVQLLRQGRFNLPIQLARRAYRVRRWHLTRSQLAQRVFPRGRVAIQVQFTRKLETARKRIRSMTITTIRVGKCHDGCSRVGSRCERCPCSVLLACDRHGVQQDEQNQPRCVNDVKHPSQRMQRQQCAALTPRSW